MKLKGKRSKLFIQPVEQTCAWALRQFNPFVHHLSVCPALASRGHRESKPCSGRRDVCVALSPTKNDDDAWFPVPAGVMLRVGLKMLHCGVMSL